MTTQLHPKVPETATGWTEPVSGFSFRYWPKRGVMMLWRKEANPAFYGGSQIKTVAADSAIAAEWLQVLD